MTSFQRMIAAWASGEHNPAPVADLIGFRLVSEIADAEGRLVGRFTSSCLVGRP